jgi:outer membrane protein assembly factor BamB
MQQSYSWLRRWSGDRVRVDNLVLPLVVGLLAYCAIAARASDWPRFRGPNGTGIAPDDKPTPVRWSPTENLAWKVQLPGPGSSSPIVVGDRVFVTCYSGYGIDPQNPGDMQNLRRHLVCVDRKEGTVLWTATVEPYLPEDPFRGNFTQHGYASHTPVSDGERVYCFFGKTGVIAFDLHGNIVWKTQVGTESNPQGWGTASSPILYENLVIVTAAAESQSIVALDKSNGTIVWRAEAAGLTGVWGTPVLVKVSEERTDLAIMVPNEIWGLNPTTGKLRWYCRGTPGNTACSSLIVVDDLLIGIESQGGGSVAVRAGGEGDVTATHVVWTGRDNNRISTPVAFQGRVYFVNNRVINCLDALSGQRLFQARLEGGSGPTAGNRGPMAPGGIRGQAPPTQPGGGTPGRRGAPFGRGGMGGFGGGDYSSPVIADGKLYFVARNGDMYVLRAGTSYEPLAVNRVTTESEDFSATPAICDGQIFVRSNRYLYCIADKSSS